MHHIKHIKHFKHLTCPQTISTTIKRANHARKQYYLRQNNELILRFNVEQKKNKRREIKEMDKTKTTTKIKTRIYAAQSINLLGICRRPQY